LQISFNCKLDEKQLQLFDLKTSPGYPLTLAGARMYQNGRKIYQMAIKYTKWQLNRPNGHKIYQHLSLQDTAKFTQIGIFGLKIYHVATTVS
jgi:hypothetical protein